MHLERYELLSPFHKLAHLESFCVRIPKSNHVVAALAQRDRDTTDVIIGGQHRVILLTNDSLSTELIQAS